MCLRESAWYAKAVFRECGLCLCSWLTGWNCVNAGSPPAPLFLAQSGGCLWLFKTQLMQCSRGRKGTLGMIMSWPPLVTIICFLPFLMWIWGTRHHLIKANQPSNSADNDGFNIWPHDFVYPGRPSRICEKATRNIQGVGWPSCGQGGLELTD